MNHCIPTDAGWALDEYDAPEFWRRVDFNGGEPYRADPLVDQSRVTGECWRWTGWHDGGHPRYGRMRFGSRHERAHRVAFRDFNNRIPEGWVVDHLCRNTICVNPNHLEAVEQPENVRRGRVALSNREECRNGHPLTPDNVKVRRLRGKDIPGCKTCLAESRHRTYERRKQAA